MRGFFAALRMTRFCGGSRLRGIFAFMRCGMAGLLFAIVAFAVGAQAQRASADVWRAEIRHALYVPDTLPPLEAKVWSSFSPTAGVIADRVTYATADGMLVPAIVYRPDPKATPYRGKLPGIVVVNGHGSDKFGWYAFYSGEMLAKAGAVVVTYDPIGEGERNLTRKSMQSPSPHDADVAPPAPLPHDDWGRRLGGLMQVDLMQAVSYLDAQPEVDAKRIAVVGYSMGAFIAGIEGAYDLRVHAVLLSGGGTYDDGAGGYFDLNHNPCQNAPYRALALLLQIDGKPMRGTILFALNAERGPMYVMNGEADTVMDIPHHAADWFAAMHERVSKEFGPRLKPENLFASAIYPGVSHRPSWVNRDGVRWLNSQIHFAFWNTDSKIDAQGTTHISEWITANRVAISKNYFPEDREGGLQAVGTGITSIARQDLMVLPDADWRRLQDRLTYEAWAAKAMEAEKQMALSALGAR
jgi:dienelactone hydrolase